MLRRIRVSLLRAAKAAGMFDRVRDSKWRRRQLLILCYHCLALEEENFWRPALFLTPGRLQARLEMLKQGGYHVLPLAEGLERLGSNDLPPRSVALTFDDGTYDFYRLAYPLLRQYGFPATVYQTTYYCSRPIPVFPLICSFMLWKKRDSSLALTPSIGIMQEISLATRETRENAVREMAAFAEREQLSTLQKNELCAELARRLGLDYQELVRKRILQLMTPEEIAEVAAGGISFELHTHRHRVPRDRHLFEREIRDNRETLEAITRTRTSHFCYPSGDYDLMFLPWLTEQGVASATTCEAGMASARSQPLLLPRFIDTTGQTDLEFESWLTGAGALLASGASIAQLRSVSR